jgi:hypothetical protein
MRAAATYLARFRRRRTSFSALARGLASLLTQQNELRANRYAKLGDIIMLFMFYTATICASDASSGCAFSGTADPNGVCGKTHASAVFAWFGFFGIIAGIYLRDPATFKKLVLGNKSDNYDDIDAPAGGAAPAAKAAVDL